MTLTQFLILLSLAVAICFYIYLIYSGLYRAVIIERNELSLLAKPSTIVYKFIRGPHKLWHRAFNQLVKIQPDCRSFGIFYDNPQEVAGDECRSVIGVIVNEDEHQPEMIEKLIQDGYLKGSFPSVKSAVYVKFPKFRLNAYPFMEIYEKSNLYIVTPLDNQDKFYVPEYHQLERKKQD